jgi:hypothetical protein
VAKLARIGPILQLVAGQIREELGGVALVTAPDTRYGGDMDDSGRAWASHAIIARAHR